MMRRARGLVRPSYVRPSYLFQQRLYAAPPPKKESLRSMVKKTMLNKPTLTIFLGHLWPKDRADLKAR
jgi:hypothetical protein